METRTEKIVTVGMLCFILVFIVLNLLYRSASNNNLPMFSLEAIKAGWPYWLGMSVGLMGYLTYWMYGVLRGKDRRDRRGQDQ